MSTSNMWGMLFCYCRSKAPISVAELAYGVQKSRFQEQNQKALEQFLAPLIITGLDMQAAYVYGQIRAIFEARGKPIGSMDTLIAGHALSLNVTLVSNNEREFSRVPNLSVENWMSSS